jgi:signal transduction histidine kinase
VGRFFQSLAGRLLGLTALFVLVAEALFFAPALANFHETWLRDRVDTAQIAALALEAAPPEGVAAPLETELLDNAGVLLVALQRDGERVLRLSQPEAAALPTVQRRVDLRDLSFWQSLQAALSLLASPQPELLQVVARPRLESGDFIEVVLSDQPLRQDLRRFAARQLLNSLLVVAGAGLALYAVLLAVLVRPIRRLTRHIERFRERPQDASRALKPTGRDDELGRAEVALAAMEEEIRAGLRQRERLASLGSAVAKIAHDLRASLATAQLLTERLATSEDPAVRQVAPRLERAIERGAALAQAALKYGKADEPAPQLQLVDVHAGLEEAAAEALAAFAGVEWRNAVALSLKAGADPVLLHRIVTNLLRNAAQAISAQQNRTDAGVIAVTAMAGGGRVILRFVDNGPGLPDKVRAKLFEPFSGAGRQDGAGLGLAIARELARAQGGELELVQSSPEGATFQLTLPALPPIEQEPEA